MAAYLHLNDNTVVCEFFFWQGLTGGDGHQQRTDYVISTKATPGRYEENNYSIQFVSGTHIWHRVVVNHGGRSFFWIMNLSLTRMFCAQVVYNTIISCCTCGKIFLTPRQYSIQDGRMFAFWKWYVTCERNVEVHFLKVFCEVIKILLEHIEMEHDNQVL